MFMIDSRGINLLPNLAATALGSRSFLYPLPLPAPPFIPSLFFFFQHKVTVRIEPDHAIGYHFHLLSYLGFFAI